MCRINWEKISSRKFFIQNEATGNCFHCSTLHSSTIKPNFSKRKFSQNFWILFCCFLIFSFSTINCYVNSNFQHTLFSTQQQQQQYHNHNQQSSAPSTFANSVQFFTNNNNNNNHYSPNSYYSSEDFQLSSDSSIGLTTNSGPVFNLEPSSASSSQNLVEYFNNQTKRAKIRCKVSGYPAPVIHWRIDNVTFNFQDDEHRGSGDSGGLSESRTGSWNHEPTGPFRLYYSRQLQTMISLRNDGQTLLIGGGQQQQQPWNSDRYSTISTPTVPVSSSSSTSSSLNYQFITVHRIECFASNKFGSILSRPVFVQYWSTADLSAPSVDNQDSIHRHFGAINSVPPSFFSSSSTYWNTALPHTPFHQHQSNVAPTISLQLYDEFVARGNVAVFKCLVIPTVSGSSSSSGNSPYLSSASSSLSLAAASSTNSQSTGSAKQRTSSPYHHYSSTGPYSPHNTPTDPAVFQLDLVGDFLFEWKIKNGPPGLTAGTPSGGDIILTLRSNQTQGKYTAYPTGELHIRDVDEHDARRTYQCTVSRRPKPTNSELLFASSSTLSSASSAAAAAASSSAQHQSQYHHHHSAASYHSSVPDPAGSKFESSFAQIILSGSEKDLFLPRIVHRTNEIFAQNNQLESILIPCAAHAQPLPIYKWYWMPFTGSESDQAEQLSHLDWLQQQTGNGNNNQQQQQDTQPDSPIPIPLFQNTIMDSGQQQRGFLPLSGSGTGGTSNQQRNIRKNLQRLRNLGSSLYIPGPITQYDSGQYVAIVSNSAGMDRCITKLYVRSPLSIQLEPVGIGSNHHTSYDNSDSGVYNRQNQPESTTQHKIIKVIRGELLQLKCAVSGFPVDDIYWLHNTIPISSDSNIAFHQMSPHSFSNSRSYDEQTSKGGDTGSDSGATTVQKLSLKFDDQQQSGMYQCFARNRFETIQATIQIMVIDQPPSIVEQFNEQTVQPGDFVSLRCTSYGSPLAQIEWSVDRLPIATNSARFRFGDYVISKKVISPIILHRTAADSQLVSQLISHFNISSVRVEDGGLYRCTAKNVAGIAFHEARINVVGKGTTKVHSPNITALSGTDITLNCPYYGFPVREISWFGRDGSQRKLPTNGRQHISSNGTLHLSKVNKKEDEGFYECEISQESHSQTSRAKIYLKIIAGPRIDNFTFASNLEEGMRSVAVCAVISGDSPIGISWLKDGVPLSSVPVAGAEFKIEMVNEFTSSITFTALRRKHVGRYTCIASNLAASDQHSADLRVNVAPVWIYEPRDIIAISGQHLTINCQAEGIPEPQIRWKMEQNVGSTGAVSATKKSSSSSSGSGTSGTDSGNSNAFHAVISNPHIQILENGSLVIKEIGRDDHRRYMCSAFNGVGSGISTIIRLSVHFPPQFMTGYYENRLARLSETVVLTCLVKVEHIDEPTTTDSNNPKQQQLLELKLKQSKLSDFKLSLIEMIWFREDTNSGLITEISAHEPGNEQQQQQKQQSSSSVHHNHHRYHVMPTFEVTDPGSLTNFSSQAIAGGITAHTLYYATKLTVRNLERKDTGAFLCLARNRYGMVRKNFTLTVTEVPDRAVDVRSESVNSNSIKIRWQPPYDGNIPITEFVIVYRSLSSSVPITVSVSAFYHQQQNSVSSSSLVSSPVSSVSVISATSGQNEHDNSKRFMTYQLTELIPFTVYSIQIKAKNSIGYSAFSEPLMVKTAEEPPNDIPSDVTILPLTTRSLKISWRRPNRIIQLSSGSGPGSSTGKQPAYKPPITGYYIGYRVNRELENLNPNHQNNQNYLDSIVGSGTEFVFKTVKATAVAPGSGPTPDQQGRPSHHHPETESFVLNNLKRSTRYDIKIQAFNLAGAGPSTSEFVAKTLDFDVPQAPKIRALKSNLSSIELIWSVQGEEPITGYIISYKIAQPQQSNNNNNNEQSSNNDDNSVGIEIAPEPNHSILDSIEWKTIKFERNQTLSSLKLSSTSSSTATNNNQDIFGNTWSGSSSLSSNSDGFGTSGSASSTSSETIQKQTFILSDLRCGSKYFIYVNAYNSAGQGDPSEVILSRTEGNVPIAPENVYDFLVANSTSAQLNLLQWKKLGCPLESFDFEYRLYTNFGARPGTQPAVSQKLTYRLPGSMKSGSLQNNQFPVAYDDLTNEISEPFEESTILDSMNNSSTLFHYELTNLEAGSWYELIVRANTDSGHTVREYIFSTLQLNGATVEPLTLKAIEEWKSSSSSISSRNSNIGGVIGSGGAGVGGGGAMNSLRSTLFAQLHYIVPVSCTLFILFLVTIVVCTIQTTQRNQFLLQLVSGRNHRHNKVSGKSLESVNTATGTTITGGTSSTVCGGGGGGAGGTHYSSSIVSSMNCGGGGGGTFNDPNGTNGMMMPMMALMAMQQQNQRNESLGEMGDSDGNSNDNDFAKLYQHQQQQQQQDHKNRSDSCHSIGCDKQNDIPNQMDPGTFHLDTIKMLKSYDNQSGSNKNHRQPQGQFPLYSLPVPYATSGILAQNSIELKQSQQSQNIYGTRLSEMAGHQQIQQQQQGSTQGGGGPCYTQRQLNEMYCENGPGSQQQQQQNQSILLPLPPPPLPQTSSSGPSLAPILRQQLGHHHQYELPFVFGGKKLSVNSAGGATAAPSSTTGTHHNESTAF